MPTVIVTFTDGTTKTYRPRVAGFGGVDPQLCGDPDHMPVLDVRRSEFTPVDFVAEDARPQTWAWAWDGARPERQLGDDTRVGDVAL